MSVVLIGLYYAVIALCIFRFLHTSDEHRVLLEGPLNFSYSDVLFVNEKQRSSVEHSLRIEQFRDRTSSMHTFPSAPPALIIPTATTTTHVSEFPLLSTTGDRNDSFLPHRHHGDRPCDSSGGWPQHHPSVQFSLRDCTGKCDNASLAKIRAVDPTVNTSGFSLRMFGFFSWNVITTALFVRASPHFF
eukprot:ANDGO_06729.mRNA.1 hypothetical protein